MSIQISGVRIPIGTDLEIEVNADANQEAPGGSITVYYKGCEVGDVLVEFWQGKFSLYAWDVYDCGGDPSFKTEATLPELEQALIVIGDLPKEVQEVSNDKA